jgi:uncharacterized protein (TIGR00269 family)
MYWQKERMNFGSSRSLMADEGCSLCGKPPVARLIDPERRLCAEHFLKDCAARVKAGIMEAGLLAPGDRIAVGLSGGKDSTLLLILLHGIVSSCEGVQLVAITVDEGIAGYREETVAAAVDLTNRLGIEHRIVSFSDLFGADLDLLLSDREAEACTVCGVLRRRALAVAAAEVGATHIATGHNLDDEAQSVLMNILRGDLPKLLLDTSEGLPDCFIPRIKPLSVLSEKEITTYLLVSGAYTDLPECPYAGGALRGEVRGMLADLEFRYPGTRWRLIRSRDQVRNLLAEEVSQGVLRRCVRCGEVSSGEVCSVCRVLGR